MHDSWTQSRSFCVTIQLLLCTFQGDIQLHFQAKIGFHPAVDSAFCFLCKGSTFSNLERNAFDLGLGEFQDLAFDMFAIRNADRDEYL